jgi:hypothetical protein
MAERLGVPARLNEHFMDRVVVDCPACGGLAVIIIEEDKGSEAIGWGSERHHAARRLTCTACFHQRRAARQALADPTMGLPLRLRGESRHGTLFAVNEAHLDYIEAYVRDPLRREVVEAGGIRNQSVASRLPRWVKAAKNREDVLKLIERMRRRLG